MRRPRWTFCHTVKREEAHLSPTSKHFLEGKQRPVHAANPIPSSHQLSLPLLNKIHPVLWVSLHRALQKGSPALHFTGDQRTTQRQLRFGAVKPPPAQRSKAAVGSGLSPQAQSIWLGRVLAAAMGGTNNDPEALSIYTCQGFGPFPKLGRAQGSGH